MYTLAAYDNRSVVIPWHDDSMPYVTEKIEEITVNPLRLRPSAKHVSKRRQGPEKASMLSTVAMQQGAELRIKFAGN